MEGLTQVSLAQGSSRRGDLLPLPSRREAGRTTTGCAHGRLAQDALHHYVAQPGRSHSGVPDTAHSRGGYG